MATSQASLTASASLLHNNLAASKGGSLVCVHNSANAGAGKLLVYSTVSGSSKDGPEVTQVTSLNYVQLACGTFVFCVSSTNGTQIYNEDVTTLLFFMPLTDNATDADILKYHQGVCVVPALQHIAVGSSKGGIALVHAASADRYTALPPSSPTSPVSAVADLCYSPTTDSVASVHNNGELIIWAPNAAGSYAVASVVPDCGKAPLRVCSLGGRLAVAFGPGTIGLFDAATCEMQAEITAHARWISALTAKEDGCTFASVGEDCVLNVWQVDPASGSVTLAASSVVTDKLLTGVAFIQSGGCAVAAYDSSDLYFAGS